MVCEYNQFGFWLDWCLDKKQGEKNLTKDGEAILRALCECEKKEDRQNLYNAVVTYFDGGNFEEYLTANTYPTFILFVQILENKEKKK